MTKTKTITAYKGFNKDWTCREFQYEIGKSYEHEGHVGVCNSGFHACENPFDVWDYYGPFESKFAKVQLTGEFSKEKDGDSKIASSKISIDVELTLPVFIKECVDWIFVQTKKKNNKDSAKLASSGDYAQLASSGDSAQLASSGDYAKLASSGYSAKLASSGYYAQLASSGDSAQLASSGYYAQLASSGDSAKLASSGYSAKLASSGDYAKIETSGDKSVIASAGNATRAKGVDGTWISLAEFNDDGDCIGFATGCIGQKRLKPDTWYRAKGGKLVQVKS